MRGAGAVGWAYRHCRKDVVPLQKLPNRTYRTQPFLGFDLACIDTPYFIADTLARASERTRPHIISYLNASMVNLAGEDQEFARSLARFDCLYADGQAIVWASRYLRRPVPARINAGDFTREFIAELAGRGLKLALIGGAPRPHTAHGEAELAARTFQRWSPDLQVVYVHHGYFDDHKAAIIEQELEEANPDIVLLGMGAAVQERWALRWSRSLGPRVWWCVGALFEYYSGTRWRAPRWMRRCGLEWAFRLILEPRRLFRRYVIGNPKFIHRVLKRRPVKGAGVQANI